MKKSNLGVLIVFAIFLLSFNSNNVAAVPGIPHQFYGSVRIDGSPASDGINIIAKIDGVEVANTTTINGTYGYDHLFLIPDPNNDGEGKTIYFFVNDILTNQSIFHNGSITELNLDAITPSCTIPTNRMNIVNDTVFCPGTYYLTPGIIQLVEDNVELDCNGATLVGDGSYYAFVLHKASNMTVRNCNIINYYIGISLSPLSGSWSEMTYNNLLENNRIVNNTYGIHLFGSDNNSITKNTIMNSGEYSLHAVGSYSNNIWANDFYDDVYDTNEENNTYCINGVGNRYFNNATGPICPDECTTPTDGMNITENTTFCLGTYDLSNGVNIVADNVILDCNEATLKGNSSISIASIIGNRKGDITPSNLPSLFEFYNSREYSELLFNSELESRFFGYVQSVSPLIDGISIIDKNGVIIKNCNVEGYSGSGIELYNSSNSKIINNTLSDNKPNFGIRIDYSSNAYLSNNSMLNNRAGLFVCCYGQSQYNHIIDTTNTVNGKPVFYYFDQENQVIENKDIGHLTLAYCENIRVKNNNISDGDGVRLHYTGNSIIEDNTVLNNDDGIRLYWSSNNNKILNNTVSSNLFGIGLSTSYNNTIRNNYAYGNLNGIGIYSSYYNIISNNNIDSSTGTGIKLYSSSNNLILNNNILNSGSIPGSFLAYGIRVWYSENNNIFNNNISSTVGHGIELFGMESWGYSINNAIEHNNIWNNSYSNLFNNQPANVAAENNWWGTNVESEIAAKIYDYYDNSELGVVDYCPYLDDQYPYGNSTPCAIPYINATIDCKPDTLQLKSKGKCFTCYIELPSGYDVNQINISNVELITDIGNVSANPKPTEIGDYDSDSIPDLMVKFNRAAVESILIVGNQTVTVIGNANETPFEGFDVIRVINSPSGLIIPERCDINGDCRINIFDLAMTGIAFDAKPGDSNWNANADFNLDLQINIFDLAAVGINFGKRF